MEEERAELCRQLEQADTSLVFLGLLLCSIGLSWRGIAQQRQGLCRVRRPAGRCLRPDVPGSHGAVFRLT